MNSFLASIFSSPSKTPSRHDHATPRRKHDSSMRSPLKHRLGPDSASTGSTVRKSVSFREPPQEQTPPRLALKPSPNEARADGEDKENANINDAIGKQETPDDSRDSEQLPTTPTRLPKSADSDDDDDDNEYTFKSFAAYRWRGDAIEIKVEWTGGDATWEPEANLQADAPSALLGYWQALGGRPINPRNADLYDVYAILSHSKDRKQVSVQWVGFGPKEATWEPRYKIAKVAPEISTKYWASVQPGHRGRPKAKARAARATTTK